MIIDILFGSGYAGLGVNAALGQTSFETVAGRPAAVLGYRLWQRKFAGDPEIVGRTIVLGGKPFAVAGVMPHEFTWLVRGVTNDVFVSADAWFDVLQRSGKLRNGHEDFEIIARLKPGVNRERAAAQLDAAIRGEGKYRPAPKGATGTFLEARFAPGWQATLTGGGGLLLVLGLALFVACANAAQLRLSQAEARKKEFGIRIALGAGSLRVARQLLVETAFVGVAGARLGVLLARFLMEKAAAFLSAGSGFADYGIRLDCRVLAYALVAALASVLLSGLAPARAVPGRNES